MSVVICDEGWVTADPTHHTRVIDRRSFAAMLSFAPFTLTLSLGRRKTRRREGELVETWVFGVYRLVVVVKSSAIDYCCRVLLLSLWTNRTVRPNTQHATLRGEKNQGQLIVAQLVGGVTLHYTGR